MTTEFEVQDEHEEEQAGFAVCQKAIDELPALMAEIEALDPNTPNAPNRLQQLQAEIDAHLGAIEAYMPDLEREYLSGSKGLLFE